MPITFRTTGAWGAGKGADLTASEIDNNFYSLDTRITSLETNPPEPLKISNIDVIENQMTIYLENGTAFGPYTLPISRFRFRGELTAALYLLAGDIFYVRNNTVDNGSYVIETRSHGGYYITLQNHTVELDVLSDNQGNFIANIFNPLKQNGTNPLYCQLSNTPYFNELSSPSDYTNVPPFTLLELTVNSINGSNGNTYLTLDTILNFNQNNIQDYIDQNRVVNLTNLENVSFFSLKDAPANSANNVGKFLKVNQTGTGLEFAQMSIADLSDGPGSLTNNANKIVAVNSNATGLTYIEPSFLVLNDTPNSYTNQGGKIVAVNSGATALEFVSPFAGTFVALTDTPSSYTGAGGKYIAVNSGATALEFVNAPSTAFTSLTDVPQSYTNQANKYVAVNSAGTALEFVPSTIASPLTYLTAQTPTSGTFVEFLNIPNTAKRIHIHFSGIRLSGTSDYIVQLGNSGGYIATGYTSTYSYLRTSANGSLGTITTGFAVGGGTTLSLHGTLSLVLCDSATRLWTESYIMAGISGTNYFTYHGGGSKTLGANTDVTQIKIASNNGTDTFAAGTINISYEL